MQPYIYRKPIYIYPANKAKESQKKLLSLNKGYSQMDFDSFNEMAHNLEQSLHQINVTLMECYFRAKGKSATIYNIKISTPGTCDIFKLLPTIKEAFDLSEMDSQFTFINVNTEKQEVYIEFTWEY